MKLQIELNNHPYKTDALYAAISIRGGYITKNYIKDDNTKFIGNYAFYNVLFNYYQLKYKPMSLNYDVQRAVSTILFAAKQSEFVSELNKVFTILFNSEYSEDFFDHAKEMTKNSFAACYKDGAFRARYKAYEFSDLSKHFTLHELINDIVQIDFKTFQICAKTLLVPANICVYIIGETDKLKLDNIKLPESCNIAAESIAVAGYAFDPYLRQNAHVVNYARKDYNLVIEAFDFMNLHITNFAKQLIVEILAESLCVADTEVWVDSLDASIIIPTEYLQSMKNKISDVETKTFYDAKMRLLNSYISLMEKQPEYFVLKSANLMLSGIYIDQYISYLAICSYETFMEIYKNADLIISEAQIFLGKELK